MRPSVVRVTAHDVSRGAISDNCLAHFINVHYFGPFLLCLSRVVHPIDILKKCLERRHQLLVRWSSQELQRLDGIWAYGNRRIGNDVRDKIAGWEVIIGSGRISVGRRHHKRDVLLYGSVDRVRVVLLHIDG